MDDHRGRLSLLHGEIRALHARFAFVTGERDAGRITLKEEGALLLNIIHATGLVMGRVTALMGE